MSINKLFSIDKNMFDEIFIFVPATSLLSFTMTSKLSYQQYKNSRICYHLDNFMIYPYDRQMNEYYHSMMYYHFSLINNIMMLNWAKNSGLKLSYFYGPLTIASTNGYLLVLEWWKNSGLKLKYNHNAMTFASKMGHVHILEWWKRSGLELKYNNDGILFAFTAGHTHVINWWKNSGLCIELNIVLYEKKIEIFNDLCIDND